MVQMVMNLSAGLGNVRSANIAMQSHRVALLRKLTGFAIVGSGYAVIVAHGLMHVMR
jgi:hypothetical protein